MVWRGGRKADGAGLGERGGGGRRAYNCLRKAGIRDLSIKLYHGLRHEILNEASKLYVYQDVLDWLEARI